MTSATTEQFHPLRVCRTCNQPEVQCVCEPVRDCPRCGGKGFNCIDDICHGKGYCIHDGACWHCETTGAVLPERVLVVPDADALSCREYARNHPNLRKVKYAVDDRDPLTGACYPLAEAYYHLRGQEPEVYCLSWSDVDDALEGTHWYLREPDGERRWIDVSLPAAPPVELPPFEQGTHRGFITGDEPSKRTRKVLAAVRGGDGDG